VAQQMAAVVHAVVLQIMDALAMIHYTVMEQIPIQVEHVPATLAIRVPHHKLVTRQ
jgi:hypothetical protein